MDWAINRKTGDDFLIINTGSNQWNYQVKELAQAVQKYFPDIAVEINENAQPDKRSYKVNFNLFEQMGGDYQPQVSLSAAVEDLKNGLLQIDFKDSEFRQSKLIRLHTISFLLKQKLIDENLFYIK